MDESIKPLGGAPRLQPLVHVEDMAAAVAFYEALGGVVRQGSRDGGWVLMGIGGGEIGLLAHPPSPAQNEGTVELNFQAAGPLDELERALRRAGVAIVRPVNDEGWQAEHVPVPSGCPADVGDVPGDLAGLPGL